MHVTTIKPDNIQLCCGDCLDVLRGWPADCIDLVVTSPPYEDARDYGIGFRLKGQAWVDWMLVRVREFVRVCRGLVVVVAWGRTRNRAYSPVCEMLLADAHRAGITLWRPAVFHRVGIPGSGGDQGLRSDWEFCLMFKPPGKLPWADNTACGHAPKWAPGGELSHRLSDGTRRNQWGGGAKSTGGERGRDGNRSLNKGRPSHRFATKRTHTKRRSNGSMEEQGYNPPVRANPGDVIECKVGGGQMGHPLAHENEAPFPVKLAEFFVLSYCPPGGLVCDPFCGSGTTLHAASMHGRRWVGIDIRESQVELARRRMKDVESQPNLFVASTTKR